MSAAAKDPTTALRAELSAYFARVSARLDGLYEWAIPALHIPELETQIPFDRGTDTLAAANARLKRTLSLAWQDRPGDRLSIARWYVAKWGGVPGNKPETLKSYVDRSEVELAACRIDRVATWSKILVIREPNQYAILDARVAASLNALQLIARVDRPILFPNLLSRNTAINAFQDWLKTQSPPGAYKLPRREVYQVYLGLLWEVAREAGLSSLDQIEMILFADAVNLANKAMAAS
jgi:hypothetical protein